MGQPGKTPEQNWREGTAYSQVHRQRLQIPTGFGKDDAERITVVLYDVSGSMHGDPLKFQAGLISAFTAQAISDVSPSGAHRHRVVLVPFHDQVGEPKKVTNTAEALAILDNYEKKLDWGSGGTDIQKALIQAMALIADAERRSGEPLAAANIVLMTDGQSPLDIPALSEARNAIDRSTPLQIMFVAIGSSNEELIKFVQESQKAGIEQGFYRHFDNSKMSEILKKAAAPLNGTKPGALYTEKTAYDLPRSTEHHLRNAADYLSKFVSQVQASHKHTSPVEHLNDIQKLSWNRSESTERPLETWIQDLRKAGYTRVLANDKTLNLRARIADDIFKHFEKLTGVKFNELSQKEQTELKHYYCHAANMGALGCP
jgi:Mg-chelatase subunit ChlD